MTKNTSKNGKSVAGIICIKAPETLIPAAKITKPGIALIVVPRGLPSSSAASSTHTKLMEMESLFISKSCFRIITSYLLR